MSILRAFSTQLGDARRLLHTARYVNQMTTPNQYDPEQHHRCSIRLKGYDYSWPGAYFITVCVHDKRCLLGKVVDGKMISNRYGRVVAECWQGIPAHFVGVTLDQWVIMPNHMHGIIMLATRPTSAVGARHAVPSVNAAPSRPRKQFGQSIPGSIPTIIRSFKSAATKRINESGGAPGGKLWQRNYWEHIVRDEMELHHVREYIQHNPIRWESDRLYRSP
uniref:REP element-mobilizing transposase RayT n=1 Tax=Candidatus Kentrum sp. DK TaxID=2126562 RepID=A0A450SQ89_9GAMM|nr:MAG: REP element-mobilizing transposase RayT [Candidatus Kentron sp. DK]